MPPKKIRARSRNSQEVFHEPGNPRLRWVEHELTETRPATHCCLGATFISKTGFTSSTFKTVPTGSPTCDTGWTTRRVAQRARDGVRQAPGQLAPGSRLEPILLG